jgi:hypothetical protein
MEPGENDCAGGRVSHEATHLEVAVTDSPTEGRAVEETPVCRDHFGRKADYEVRDREVVSLKRRRL